MPYIRRIAEERVTRALEPGRIVLVTGARRAGKTGLLRKIAESFRERSVMLDGEDYGTQVLFRNGAEDADGDVWHVLAGTDLLILDELQYIPQIGRVLNAVLERFPAIRILASGSYPAAGLDRHKCLESVSGCAEERAGKCTHIVMPHISVAEIDNACTNRDNGSCYSGYKSSNLESIMIYGSYPEVLLEDTPEGKSDRLREICGAYLMKDILYLEDVKNAARMLELLRLVAVRIGKVVTYEELGHELGMSRITVEKYMEMLERASVIYHVGAWSHSMRKEMLKAKKWYFCDNGVRNSLISDFAPLHERQDVEALWENFIVGERIKASCNTGKEKKFHFWRTYGKQEIDLLEESDDGLTALEFKWKDSTAAIPKSFREAYPDAGFSVVTKDNYKDYI